MSRIKSLSITTEGKSEPVKDADQYESELDAATERWEHMREEVKGKRWSQCPPELVADFMKSAARDISRQYGRGAMTQTIISAAVARARIDPENLDMRLACQSADGKGGIEIVLSTHPENTDRDEEEFTAVELDVDMSPDDLDEISSTSSPGDVLKKVMKKDNRPEERKVFDPLEEGNVSDDQILELVRSIEEQLPIVEDQRQENEFDVMLTAAGVLLVWKNAEITNASTTTFSLNGLYNGDTEVYPGLTVKAECQTQIHDSQLKLVEDEELVSAKISVTKPRRNRP